MIVSTIIMSGVKINYTLSDKDIIMRAKELDMVFRDEVKVIYWEDDDSND